ncbi:MAG: hypothetical protein WBF53_05055 [Litorimonas sp.]
MSTLTVRRLPDIVYRALKAQAAQEGISAEEKARRILALHLQAGVESGLGSEMAGLARELGISDEAFQLPNRADGDVEPALFG